MEYEEPHKGRLRKNAMLDAIWNVGKASSLLVNLPITAALVAAFLYWLLVLLGALDFELGGHDVDIHTDGHLGGGHDADVHHDHHQEIHSPGAISSFLQFLHIGDAPMMVVLSAMALLAWAFAVIANVYLNQGSSLLVASVLLLPNGIFTIVATHYLLKPVAKFIRSLNEDAEKAPPMVGQVGEVTTTEVTDKFGMALVHIKGAPVAIQIRNYKGDLIKKGDRVLVIEEDKKNHNFEVVIYNQTELEE